MEWLVDMLVAMAPRFKAYRFRSRGMASGSATASKVGVPLPLGPPLAVWRGQLARRYPLVMGGKKANSSPGCSR